MLEEAQVFHFLCLEAPSRAQAFGRHRAEQVEMTGLKLAELQDEAAPVD